MSNDRQTPSQRLSFIIVSMYLFSINTLSCASLDLFISETRDTLNYRKENNGSVWPRAPDTNYSLTDPLCIGNYSIQLNEFCVTIRTFDESIQLLSSQMDTFTICIFYEDKPVPELRATIQSINSGPLMSGTEIMLLIHYILHALGVKRCTLLNRALFWYRTDVNGRVSIPLINLRCIHGEITDWYTSFGYRNANTYRIALKMEAIHDIKIGDKKLGPLLLSLWNRADKTEFHTTYMRFEGYFSSLTMLRDSHRWIVFL